MTRKTELKPCPFCGANPTIDHWSEDYFVYCGNKKCRVQPSAFGQPTLEEAEDVWNRRGDK